MSAVRFSRVASYALSPRAAVQQCCARHRGVSDRRLDVEPEMRERGRTVVKEHAFEGILPSLERRYKETDSLVVREELAKYRNTKACPSCEGTRLRLEARHVRIGERAIYEVSGFPLKQALEFFRQL